MARLAGERRFCGVCDISQASRGECRTSGRGDFRQKEEQSRQNGASDQLSWPPCSDRRNRTARGEAAEWVRAGFPPRFGDQVGGSCTRSPFGATLRVGLTDSERRPIWETTSACSTSTCRRASRRSCGGRARPASPRCCGSGFHTPPASTCSTPGFCSSSPGRRGGCGSGCGRSVRRRAPRPSSWTRCMASSRATGCASSCAVRVRENSSAGERTCSAGGHGGSPCIRLRGAKSPISISSRR